MRRLKSSLLALMLGLGVGACSTTTQDPGAVGANEDGRGRQDQTPVQTPVVSDDPERYAWEPLTPQAGSLALVDPATGTKFNLRGEAVEGPLAAGKQLLRQIPGVNMFWFAWSVFHPGSEVWGKDSGVREATLPSEKTGVQGCFGGFDCIRSLPNTGPPTRDIPWVGKDATAAEYLSDDDIVIGVFYDGVARAYPHNVLWWHEIVNDSIGARAFSVTFCPLTGSALVFDSGDKGRTFGVSGQLFNSNLVMYDHGSESLWPQLWTGPVAGDEAEVEQFLPQLPLTETTWKQWKLLHPDTVVLSEEITGLNLSVYPYGEYRSDHGDTFRVTDPLPDDQYQNKQLTFGLFDRARSQAKAYVHADLAARAPRGVINDTFGGKPIVVAWDASAQLVVAFDVPTGDGTEPMTFEAGEF